MPMKRAAARRRRSNARVAGVAIALLLVGPPRAAPAQPPPPTPVAPGAEAAKRSPEVPDAEAQSARLAEAARRAEDDLAAGAAARKAAPAPRPQTPEEEPQEINYLGLLVRGGPLMIPIAFMSLLTVAFALERGMALRRRRVLPPRLIAGLGRLAAQPGGLDPKAAYRLCQQYPSAAAKVIRSMLLKIGRPHTEVEQAVADANDREAARLYANVRWLNLAAGVTPLLGLLGTVQGMIQAFIVTASIQGGERKAQELAEGIYTALVTTFAGLCVAIPAAIVAHFCESQIERLCRELHETLLGVLPQLERYEGRLRMSADQMEAALEAKTSMPNKEPAAR